MTPEEIKSIGLCGAYKAGCTLKQIGKAYDISDETVRRTIKKLDPAIIRRRGRQKGALSVARALEPITIEEQDELMSSTGDVTPTPVSAAE